LWEEVSTELDEVEEMAEPLRGILEAMLDIFELGFVLCYDVGTAGTFRRELETD